MKKRVHLLVLVFVWLFALAGLFLVEYLRVSFVFRRWRCSLVGGWGKSAGASVAHAQRVAVAPPGL